MNHPLGIYINLQFEARGGFDPTSYLPYSNYFEVRFFFVDWNLGDLKLLNACIEVDKSDKYGFSLSTSAFFRERKNIDSKYFYHFDSIDLTISMKVEAVSTGNLKFDIRKLFAEDPNNMDFTDATLVSIQCNLCTLSLLTLWQHLGPVLNNFFRRKTFYSTCIINLVKLFQYRNVFIITSNIWS